MHCAFQRRYATLIWTNESFVRPLVFEMLDSNMSVETTGASEKFITLDWPSLFITSAKGAVEGTP
jgi:hypothetical protein